MLNNNQSKAKQIRSFGFNGVNTMKKIRSKDSLRTQQHKNYKYQHQTNSKDKALKLNLHQQFQLHSKSKQKNRHNKIIHQQYYIQQNYPQKPKKIIQCLIPKSKSNSKTSIQEIKQKKLRQDKNINAQEHQQQISKSNRLNLPPCRSVITFDGKLITIPPKSNHIHQFNQDNLIHNYTSMSGSQYATLDKQFTNYKVVNKKVKTKSKQIPQKNVSKPKFKPSKKIIGSARHNKSQQHIKNVQVGKEKKIIPDFDTEFHRKDHMAQETQVSPFKQNEYQRPQKFDFDQIHELILQDIAACKQIKISSEYSKSRRQSIKFISELCGQLELRRETFYLAISIFDRAISKKINTESFSLLALVSLTLAMKLQQAQLSLQFVYVLGLINSGGKQSYLQSASSHKSSSKGKSINQRAESQTKKSKKPKIIIKQSNIRRISTSNISKILRKWECNKISKKITIYLRFRLWRIQAIFWADLLTCLWDQYLITDKRQFNTASSERLNQGHYQSSLSISQNIQILFRCSVSLVNINYLYQLLQMAYMNESVYNYPSIYLVLSAMYLLVRITKQSHDPYNNEDGYQFYRQSLAHSTNILFVDKTGINRIFWKFLGKLKVQMVQIIGCCQFISQFLQPKLMNNGQFNQQTKSCVDNILCLHEFNPCLYSYIS